MSDKTFDVLMDLGWALIVAGLVAAAIMIRDLLGMTID